MKRIVIVISLLAIVASATSCATIFTKSAYPITFSSNPSGANIQIENRASRIIYTGMTPSTVKLKAAAGYMKREEYLVRFQKEDLPAKTVLVTSNLDGWYIGNILLGGFIGMLIVDPASGAMYRFGETEIHADLGRYTSEAKELRIIDINQVPEGIELVRIN